MKKNKYGHKISNECISCEACVTVCPVEAIFEGDGQYIIDPDT
ncbi:MAG: 4Fe-4S binding protein [Candidatus Marinimicrobia bacterium]|nr:4Fe-4S binding protein [Candidatus Neomarinimicrobiota bacterium]